MATRPNTTERVAVLETKVENLNTKVDELKDTVKDSNAELKQQLKTMYEASCTQHAELSKDIGDLKSFKDKWLLAIAIIGPIIAFIAAHIDWPAVLQNAFK